MRKVILSVLLLMLLVTACRKSADTDVNSGGDGAGQPAAVQPGQPAQSGDAITGSMTEADSLNKDLNTSDIDSEMKDIGLDNW